MTEKYCFSIFKKKKKSNI